MDISNGPGIRVSVFKLFCNHYFKKLFSMKSLKLWCGLCLPALVFLIDACCTSVHYPLHWLYVGFAFIGMLLIQLVVLAVRPNFLYTSGILQLLFAITALICSVTDFSQSIRLLGLIVMCVTVFCYIFLWIWSKKYKEEEEKSNKL